MPSCSGTRRAFIYEHVRNETLSDELKRYVRFSAADAMHIAAMRDRVAPSFERIATEFYDRIREHEEAHAVFVDEAQIARLHRSLVQWLERLFGGVYEADFFALTERIGAVHVRVGLPQRYVVAAMSVVRTALAELVDVGARSALDRLLDLELAVILEAYRKEALQPVALATNVPTLEAAAQVAPMMIVGIDGRGVISFFNRVAEKTTGWSHDEIAGRNFFEVLIAAEHRAAAVAAFAGSTVFETPLSLRSGRTRRTRWRFAHVDDAQAGGRMTFAFGADITEEVGARTRAEQTLRTEAAATLVAGLAHAIRNPLNGAGLHLALTERSLANTDAVEAREALRVATTELRRVGDLVTEFLEFARPKPMVKEAVDVRALVERAVAKTAEAAQEVGVAVRTDLPRRSVKLAADGERIEQVLVYLIENACDVVAGAGGSVLVRVRREPKTVTIEVEDNGPGLLHPNAPIFDAFYSTKPDGTGLGLAIAHRVVAEHGGEIDVDSHPGSTRFRLRLPLFQEDDPV